MDKMHKTHKTFAIFSLVLDIKTKFIFQASSLYLRVDKCFSQRYTLEYLLNKYCILSTGG